MSRNLIVGDIHGCFDKLILALESANFKPEEDMLFSTGDLCDRGRDNISVIRYLMALPNFQMCLGNHDLWLKSYLENKYQPEKWVVNNGGSTTISEFENESVTDSEKKTMLDWLNQFPAVLSSEKYIIMHGGPANYSIENIEEFAKTKIVPKSAEEKGGITDILWDRSYINGVANEQSEKLDTTKTIFLGHTPISVPKHFRDYNLVSVDTGSYHDVGYLTVVDMDTLEFWTNLDNKKRKL